ncbi:hypothetical protein DLM45_00570 [Hyphomicrobium methylovorum]|uniref:hypothetical protein n=1 Tax=Hyphomicrobium methylovorum TaxID=84 RepID=UPI0015E630EB|nr:hypothetical protein [Hyphomicrobium methylovorum]MBA2124722.1 hypothetical protein [Hyphomicrobium methylovorum]
MQWILVERKPGVVYAEGEQIYLGSEGAEVPDLDLVMKFPTRQDAEQHRRKLKHPYHWVSATFPK